MTDPASLLSPIRERHALAVTPDPDPVFFGAIFQIKSHLVRTDVPRLLAAVEAALKHHERIERHPDLSPVCGCSRVTWPCPEVAAITAALTGQEAGDAE
jgi:hypothetical protein